MKTLNTIILCTDWSFLVDILMSVSKVGLWFGFSLQYCPRDSTTVMAVLLLYKPIAKYSYFKNMNILATKHNLNKRWDINSPMKRK